MRTGKTSKIPQTDVLKWLKDNHPELHNRTELDRAWCWIPVNLSGEQNKAIRMSIKAFGFRFAKRGHILPSGAVGHWAHAGNHPTPFIKRKTTSSSSNSERSNTKDETQIDDAIAQALAALNVA